MKIREGFFAKRQGARGGRGRPGHVAARKWPVHGTVLWTGGGGSGVHRSMVDRGRGGERGRGGAPWPRPGARRGGDTRRGEARGERGRAARNAAGPVRATAAAGRGRSARATRRRDAAAAPNSGERGRVHGRERGRAEGAYAFATTVRSQKGSHLGANGGGARRFAAAAGRGDSAAALRASDGVLAARDCTRVLGGVRAAEGRYL